MSMQLSVLAAGSLSLVTFGPALGASQGNNAPGDVLLAQKISQLEGGFLGSLHDGDEFGHALSALGYYDGGAGIVATAPGDDDGGPDRGALWFMHVDGLTGLLFPAAQVKVSATAGGFTGALDDGDRFGSSVSIGFPFNLTETFVGAVGDDDGGVDRGAIYSTFVDVFTGLVSNTTKISATAGGFTGVLDDLDAFGASVAFLEDLDGDGINDVAVGAPGDDDGGANRGAVWILLLNADRSVKSHTKISATAGGFTVNLADGDGFGSALSFWRDFDGDGRVELAVGAPMDDDGGADRGALWILRLNPDGSVHSHSKLSAASPGFGGVLADGDGFGSACSRADDGSGLGRPAIMVGAPGTDSGGPDAGAIYRFSLLPDLSITSFTTISATSGGLGSILNAGDRFGSSLASSAQVSGFGANDVSVGTPGGDDGGPDRGEHWFLRLTVGEAPLVAFTGTPTAGEAPLDVQFADESTGVINVREWDFGDGNSSGLTNVLHTYQLPGTYTVALTVTGPGGAVTLTKADYVVAGTPPAPGADFTTQVTAGFVPLDVSFTDTSTSHVDAWTWDFGDGGSSTLQDPTHTYASSGTYSVTLTASGLGGSDSQTKADHIRAVDSFVVDFDVAPASGLVPLVATFANTSLGTPDEWLWDFGDGASSSEQSPVHTYTLGGTYSVSLSAILGADSIDEAKDDLIQVQETIADFVGVPKNGMAPLTVQFNDLSAGDVTALAWDFGDGDTSTESDPSHTYFQVGTYTVALEAFGSTSSSVEQKDGYIVVSPGVPVADFDATPTMGSAPLVVQFTDLSSDPNDWLWDFGDGAISSLQHPSHNYLFPGTYSVTLVASNATGTDTLSKEDLIQSSRPTGIYDPSFELQAPGLPPLGSWEIFFGGGHVINPVAGLTGDNGLPTDGSNWCEVGADSTVNATPPSNPGGETDPAIGGAGIGTTFQWPDGLPLLEFDAAFLLNGPPNQSDFNDWMSIDVSDGTTTFNLFFGDSFSSMPNLSEKYGFAMTAVIRVSVNLVDLFPLSSSATELSLTVQVGNGGDGLLPSKGYVDDFRFGPDASISLYGSGLNPTGSMTLLLGEPTIGGFVVVGIDNPLGTQTTFFTYPILLLSLAPDPNFPAGTALPGFGMDGGDGEILIGIGVNILAPALIGFQWQGPGQPVPIAIGIPNDVLLIGRSVYGQAVLFDPTASSGGVRFGMSDGVRLILGAGSF